jgi:L,D-transpeptidase ErfK/SrfK
VLEANGLHVVQGLRGGLHILHPARVTANALLPRTACVLALLSGAAVAETFPMPAPGIDIVGAIRVVAAKQEDTLLDIARRFNLGYNEITAANPEVDAWVPGEGTPIVVPTQFVLPPGPRRGIVLNLAQMRLFYFAEPKKGQPAQVVTQPVGIGTDYARTPLGETKVVRKASDPIWRPSPDIREEHVAAGHWLEAEVKPGPDNPLGKYALYLGLSGGYLIHGTNKPWGIGMRVSHGCIRLYPEGIEALYPYVPVGAPVRIINERFFLGWRKNVPYLQAFAPTDEDAEESTDLTPLVHSLLQRAMRHGPPDWARAIEIASARRGIPVPIAPGSQRLDEILKQLTEGTSTVQ